MRYIVILNDDDDGDDGGFENSVDILWSMSFFLPNVLCFNE